jgi:uncharacterized membrane protein
MSSKAALVASRIIEAALIVLGIVLLFTPDTTNPLLFWDLLAIVYLAIRVGRLRRSRRSESAGWLAHGLGGRAGLVFTVFASLVGITAGVAIVLSEDGADRLAASFAGVPAVLFAWAILHFGYAERYAQAYYGSLPERILSFPDAEKPTFIDFTYFSFTLGTTFSVSDVETRTPGIRLQILSHSILAFIYNTVTIGIAVSVISG